MSPELSSAIQTIVTALVGALLAWLAGKLRTPAVPSPAVPTPATPDEDPARHPVIRQLLKGIIDNLPALLAAGGKIAPFILQEGPPVDVPSVATRKPVTVDLGANVLHVDENGSIHVSAK